MAKARGRTKRGAGVDEALVERTVAMLLAHDRSAAGSRRQIGAHVLDKYFEGSEALARSKDPGKSKSFARLAERAAEDTLWDARDLREAVGMELAARTLPEQVANAIDATYLLLLGGVDDLEQRVELASRLARDELRGELAKAALRAASGERRGGRKPQPAALRGASELDRDGERMELDGSFDREELGKLDPEQLGRVHDSLSRHRARVEDFLRSAAAALRGAGGERAGPKVRSGGG